MHGGKIFVHLSAVVLEDLDDLPYTPPYIEEDQAVITNLMCVYNGSCPIDDMEEFSCDNFNGSAVLTCVICKNLHSNYCYPVIPMTISCVWIILLV